MQKLLLSQLLLLEEACEEARKSGTALNDELRSAILLRCIGGQLIFFFPSPLPFGGSTVLRLTPDQWGIEPPPAVCQRHKSDVVPTEP